MNILKIKNFFIAIILGLVFLNPVKASSVWGESDCGEWVNTPKSNLTVKAWLLGFMSGLGVMYELKDATENPMGKIKSAQQIYVWMDNFCQKNPLKTVSDGGIELLIELRTK
jgi:hypothetical protein